MSSHTRTAGKYRQIYSPLYLVGLYILSEFLRPAQHLSVKIDSREPIFKTNALGEYYKILIAGNYTLSLMFNCESIYTTRIRISKSSLLVMNITLPSSLFDKSTQYKLDKYPIFCDKKTLNCSNNDLRQIKLNASNKTTVINSARMLQHGFLSLFLVLQMILLL